MHVIRAHNVNGAYAQALWDLWLLHVTPEETRNGPVQRFPEPVCTVYEYPWERVLFDAKRDANPFLHLFESLWMLAGRNDVAFPAQFSKQFLEYSDDGVTLHGAYGHRWRQHFGYDQLGEAINFLRANPTTRRCVVGMWDPYIDLQIGRGGGKDVPCNTQVLFNLGPDFKLNMTVTNRSNDMIWGCYGANVVHMSILHEYVALGAGIPLGKYYQISNDLHLYEKHWGLLGKEPPDTDPYDQLAYHEPLFAVGQIGAFDQDVANFLENPMKHIYRTAWMQNTVAPMYKAWEMHKQGYTESAIALAKQVQSEDWARAAIEWFERRNNKLRLVKP